MYEINDLRQIEALVSATRQEIVDAMQVSGPCTIKEIADLLGRAPDSLYYHFRLLEKVGLLVQVEVRPGSRREETVYDVAHRPLGIDMHQGGDKTRQAKVREAVLKITATFLRLAERGFRNAVESGLAILHGKKRNLSAGRVSTWLTHDEFLAVEAQLDEVLERCRQGRSSGSGQLYSFTYALTPLMAVTRDRRKPKNGKSVESRASSTNSSPTDSSPTRE